MIVVDPGFRFFDRGIHFSEMLVERFETQWWELLWLNISPDILYSLVSMSVLLQMLENTFNKATGVIHQGVLSTLHAEQNLVSLKLKQNEADRISLRIIRNDDIR